MTMITSRPRSGSDVRPSAAARRFGYAVGAAVNGVLLYLTNVAPGWRSVPFLTEDVTRVLGLVNLSLLTGLVANLLYGMYDRRWFRDLGAVVTTGVGLAAVVQLLRVFPFAFADSSVDWDTVTWWLLVLGVAGSVIGLVVQVVTLVWHLVTPERRS
jgi:hypothetical protein